MKKQMRRQQAKKRFLIAMVWGLGFFLTFSPALSAQGETTVIHAQWGKLLLQAEADRSQLSTITPWLKQLPPGELPPQAAWPPGLKSLQVFHPHTSRRGEQLRLRLRQAELLGLLPVVEGLSAEQARVVLGQAGLSWLKSSGEQPAIVVVPHVWLAGQSAGDEVILWLPR